MAQADITIHITKHAGRFSYFAFQGEHDHNSVKEQVESVIRREDDLIKLVAWLLVNGILSGRTRLHLTKNFLPIDLVDIQQLTEAMVRTFPIIHFSQIVPEKLVQKETVLRALVIVNFYKEPVKNAKTFHTSIMTENSYGEYFLREYTTITQLKNAMRALLTQHYVSRWNNNLEFFIPPQDEMHSIKSILEK
ncbi:MAG: Adenylate cyclase [uncultured bacterium]|nr:MAG: Adenylate cyclase [uncultured bacterium]